MREDRETPLAVVLQDKRDNQGFLSSPILDHFIREAIETATHESERGIQGVLIDGYPRCIEQMQSFNTWPLRASSQSRAS